MRHEQFDRGKEVFDTSFKRGQRLSASRKPSPGEGSILYIPGFGETSHGAFRRPIEEHVRVSGETIWCAEDPKPEDEISHEILTTIIAERKAASRAYFKGKVDNEILDKALENIPLGQFQKAYNAVQLIKEQGLAITDVVVHSQGATVITLCALLWPEYFENVHVVFVNPYGWNVEQEERKNTWLDASERIADKRNDAFVRLFKDPRAQKELKKFLAAMGKTWDLQILLDYLSHTTGFSLLRKRLEEAAELIDYNHIPALQVLSTNKMRFSALYGSNDNLVPASEVTEFVKLFPNIHAEESSGDHYELIKEPRGFALWAHSAILDERTARKAA